MSVITIQEHGQTKSGNTKVKSNGKWYFLARDIGAAPAVGATIEIREGSFMMGDPPKEFATIEAWRPVGQVPPQAAAPAQQTRPAFHNQGPSKQAPADEHIDEAKLRYISNVVGQAIAAKTIVEPGQVLAWFQAALASLKNQSAPVPFDDRIPH